MVCAMPWGLEMDGSEKAGRRTRKAVAKAEKYVAYSQRHYGAGDRKTLNARTYLADAHHEAGRTSEATAMLEQIAADSERLLARVSDDHGLLRPDR